MQANPNLGKRWDGETVVVFGGGNSLTDEQIEKVKNTDFRFIVINDTYKRVVFADVLYACDYRWWDKYFEQINFKGELWTQDLTAFFEFGLSWVLGRNKSGLGRDCVHFGYNSGYQAINLAYLWGAKRIILLGFDCKDINGKAHWFGQHPKELNQTQNYDAWIKSFNKLAIDLKEENVEVINCSPNSALECFEKNTIEKIIN